MGTQISDIKNRVNQNKPHFEVFKEGSAASSIKTNIVARSEKEIIKIFTQRGKKLGESELDLIELFNQFHSTNNTSFSGPEIIESSKGDPVYFEMKDITTTGKREINFEKETDKKLLDLYLAYREEFKRFEKFSG